jgi:hypothetical protein
MASNANSRALPANPVSAAVTTAQVFTLATNPLAPAVCVARGKSILDGKTFLVQAQGNAVTAGNYTVNCTLLAALTIPGTPLTSTNWTILGAGTARAVNTGFAPWNIQAELQFDSNGGIMHGVFSQEVNNLYNAWASLASTLTGVNGTNSTISQAGTAVPPADPCIYFAAALTFGTASVSNIGNLISLELDY